MITKLINEIVEKNFGHEINIKVNTLLHGYAWVDIKSKKQNKLGFFRNITLFTELLPHKDFNSEYLLKIKHDTYVNGDNSDCFLHGWLNADGNALQAYCLMRWRNAMAREFGEEEQFPVKQDEFGSKYMDIPYAYIIDTYAVDTGSFDSDDYILDYNYVLDSGARNPVAISLYNNSSCS